MLLAQSKITSQGQISIPAKVRKKLGINPGATLEWDEENGNIIVRRVGQYSSADIHEALFSKTPPSPKTQGDVKEGIRHYMKQRHPKTSDAGH